MMPLMKIYVRGKKGEGCLRKPITCGVLVINIINISLVNTIKAQL